MATTKKAIAEAEQAAEIKEATAAPTAEPEAPAVTLDELEGMDMNMFDVEETESAPHPVWRITDDGCADWACQKIAEEKAELDRITSLADSQIEKIQQRVVDSIVVPFGIGTGLWIAVGNFTGTDFVLGPQGQRL